MAIKKIAFSDQLHISNIVSSDVVEAEADIVNRFKEIVASLRDEQERIKVGTKIAPKVEDFIYCHAIQMHAAEANLVGEDSGEFRKNSRGEPVRGHFESVKDGRGSDSVKWVSPDGIQLYKNANGDIFPEEDLIKSHKEWVGKPLCKDHISSSVDGIRGIIVDTFYDNRFKRVHALFALDKKNYPELARKVEANYAVNVSMGTAVGRSICTECANVATTESEYCHHVKSKSNYGEINKDLKPIELSLVVVGADPRAKVRTVLASFNNYFMQKAAALADSLEESVEPTSISKNLSVSEVIDLLGALNQESEKYAEVMRHISTMKNHELRELVLKLKSMKDPTLTTVKDTIGELLAERYMASPPPALDINNAGRPTGTATQPDLGSAAATGHDLAGTSLNTEIGEDPISMVDKVVGVSRTLPDPNSGIATASAILSNFTDSSDTDVNNNSLHNRFAMLQKKEIPMNFAELRKRAEARKQAYHQGTEDPAKALPYDKMGDADKIRDTQDKQMVGDELDTSSDIPAEDAKKKDILQRASLEERRAKRAKLLEALTKQADSAKPGNVEEKTDSLGRKVMVATKPDGSKEVLKADDEAGTVEKKAFWQGTEEPTPGKTRYPLMGESHDSMRAKDKQMNGVVETGADGLFPGDEQLKKSLQRSASIKARLTKSATPGKSTWKFFAGNDEILTVKASSAYEVGLDEPVQNTAHLSQDGNDLVADDFFKTDVYAKEVMKLIRSAGLEKAAETLGGELPPPPAAPQAAPAPAVQESPADAAGEQEKDANDKIVEALASIESAVEEIRNAANIEDLKQVDVSSEGAAVTASFRTQLFKVQAELASAADELATLSESAVSSAIVDEAVSDAFTVATAAADLLDKFAAKKKKKKDDVKKMKKVKKLFDNKKLKKKDEDEDEDEELEKRASATLAELLAARAARREALVARAADDGSEWEEVTRPEIPSLLMQPDTEVDTIPEQTEVDTTALDDGLDAAEELSEALEAWDAEDAALSAKDKGDVEGPLSKEEEDEVAEIADEEVDEHEKEMHADDGLLDRKAWRASLLKKIAGEWQSTYSEARKGAGPEVSVDANVSNKLNKVETLAEVKDAMEDVARSEPRNVRMAAETLDRMIRAGAVKAAQLNELVAKGAVDAEAAKYWKEYFGQTDGGSEFAAGLTQEFKQAKASLDVKASVEEQEAKLMRAYNLALEAQERGLIPRSRTELHRFASNMVKLPTEQFEAMKNMIGQARKVDEHVKTAAPVVGLNYDRAPAVAQQPDDISVEGLTKLFF
jgi:hypothetical protein